MIAVAIAGAIVAGDVGRERNMAQSLQSCEKVWRCGEAQGALAERTSGEDFGLELGVFWILSEEEMFSDANLFAGADQAFPVVGLARELAGE